MTALGWETEMIVRVRPVLVGRQNVTDAIAASSVHLQIFRHLADGDLSRAAVPYSLVSLSDAKTSILLAHLKPDESRTGTQL